MKSMQASVGVCPWVRKLEAYAEPSVSFVIRGVIRFIKSCFICTNQAFWVTDHLLQNVCTGIESVTLTDTDGTKRKVFEKAEQKLPAARNTWLRLSLWWPRMNMGSPGRPLTPASLVTRLRLAGCAVNLPVIKILHGSMLNSHEAC